VFGTAGSTTKVRVPHPLRFFQRVGYAKVGIEIRGIPPFAKSAKDGAPRDLLHCRRRNIKPCSRLLSQFTGSTLISWRWLPSCKFPLQLRMGTAGPSATFSLLGERRDSQS
jgi:hypothetical protein